MEKKFITHSKAETQAIGQKLSSFFKPGDVVLLTGDLGAGKTTFTGGVAKGLGIGGDVISPTFNIMKCYVDGSLPLYHIDAYRLEGQNIELGLDEFIEGDGVCLIEWPMFIEPLLPDERLEVSIKNIGEDDREITITSKSQGFDKVLIELEGIL